MNESVGVGHCREDQMDEEDYWKGLRWHRRVKKWWRASWYIKDEYIRNKMLCDGCKAEMIIWTPKKVDEGESTARKIMHSLCTIKEMKRFWTYKDIYILRRDEVSAKWSESSDGVKWTELKKIWGCRHCWDGEGNWAEWVISQKTN